MLANQLIEKNITMQFLTKETVMQSGDVDDWHQHPWHQIIFPVSGLLQSNIGEKHFIVPHNGLLFIPAGQRHKSIAITQTHFLALYLNPHAATQYLNEDKSGLVTPFLKALILQLFEVETALLTEEMIRHLLVVLRDQLMLSKCFAIPLLIPKDRRLQSVFLLLKNQPDVNLTLTQCALKVGASTRTLSRLCSNEFQLSFSLWRQHIRLVLSLQLLADNKSIQNIALDLGYQSSSAYIYAFKGVFMQTPSQYRKNNRQV